MRKIENWEKEYENAEEVVSFETIPVGPQICKILKVEDIVDKEYLKIYFDIADGEYKDFFMTSYEEDTRDDKKYSNSGITYRSYKKSAEVFFMAFIKAVEKSNPDFKWDWNETKLKNTLFVSNFGEEEFVWEGEKKTSIKCREIRSTQALRDNKIKILKIKELSEKDKQKLKDEPQEQKKEKENVDTGNFNDVEDDLPF
jgi:hypothetical protein